MKPELLSPRIYEDSCELIRLNAKARPLIEKDKANGEPLAKPHTVIKEMEVLYRDMRLMGGKEVSVPKSEMEKFDYNIRYIADTLFIAGVIDRA